MSAGLGLVSKDGTYNATAYDELWWKKDRLGFDPPEEKEALRREAEWTKQIQKQQPQLYADWDEYERETAEEMKHTPTSNLSTEERKRIEKEKDDKKRGFGGFVSHAMRPNLKKLARRGIPNELRGKIWFEKSGAFLKKQNNPGVYAKYVALVTEQTTNIEEIQMDVARTFSMHLMFARSVTKTIMLRILSAFTVRNPYYGYCQNMSFIIALILFYLPEEDAFWLFTTIIEDILPVDFCSPTLIGLRVDQKILEVLLKERLPKIHAHFTRHNVDISCFTTSWLLKLFVNVFPIQTTLRVWDCFIVEGSKILFRIALAFLKIHDDQVKRCVDSGELMTFLTVECKQFYDADRLIKACASFWALRRKQINDLRMKFIEQELADNPALANQMSPHLSPSQQQQQQHNDSSSEDEGGISHGSREKEQQIGNNGAGELKLSSEQQHHHHNRQQHDQHQQHQHHQHRDHMEDLRENSTSNSVTPANHT